MLKPSKFDWRFWTITLSALATAALTFSLGIWQLQRAELKEKISLERKEAPAIALKGIWLANQTLYVDNRQMKAKLGFFVVTPFLQDNGEYVLVERGWIARDFMDRKKLQPIETVSGNVSISVRRLVDPKPPSVIAKNADVEYPIVQYLDLKTIEKSQTNRVYKGYVQQLGTNSEGLKREWFEPASGVEKHYGYAFQWFALCALLAGLYIWFQWIKK
jgi:surfeit locus 1 family protein